MSGTNALDSRSSVLSAIANPTVVNPLRAMTDATTAAKGVYEVRQQQAEQALGDILAKHTDAQGNTDYNAAAADAARAGPGVGLRFQTFLANNAARRGEQITQAGNLDNLVSTLSSSAISDSSDENMARIRARGAAAGMSASQLAEIDRIAALPEGQRKYEAWKHLSGQMGASYNLAVGGYATPTLTNINGAMVPTMITPQSPHGAGGVSQGQGSVLMTLSPAEQHTTITMPDPRRTLPDGSPNPDYAKEKPFTKVEQLEMMGFTVLPNGQVIRPGGSGGGAGGGGGGSADLGSGRYSSVPPPLRGNQNPPAQTPPPPAPATPAAPAIQFGGSPPAPPGGTPGDYTGGGIGSVLAPPAPGPRTDAAPPGNTNVAAILQGMQTARANPLGGGTMTAGPGAGPSAAPGVEPPPQPGWGSAPGTYGTAPAAVARPPPAPTQPIQPTAARSPFDRPAVSLSPAEAEQAKGAGARFDAEATAGTQAQGQHAVLGNMLADTAQFTTGPLAGIVGKLRNLGISMGLPGINVEGQSAKESFGKLAAGLANAQGAGSDSRMNVTIAGNPHEELSPAGVDLVIRQLQGNADYLQARQKLAQAWPAKSDYNGFAQSVQQLDPRVFQYERMKPDQKATWFKALDKRDQTAFMTAHGWAEDKKLIPSR